MENRNLEEITFFVPDTNTLIDFLCLIPNGERIRLEQSSVNLTGNCLIIPEAVVKELGKFKTERTDRGRIAREILRRLNALTHGKTFCAKNILDPQTFIWPETCDYAIMVLSDDDCRYRKMFHFNPPRDDMDGQIILATLSALYCINSADLGSNGEVDLESLDENRRKRVFLLSNDHEMLIRARGRGLYCDYFRCKTPSPFTGRRDLAVPDDLFARFLTGERITEEEWCLALPNEQSLVANEFLIMRPESGVYPEGYTREEYKHVGRFHMDTKVISHLEYINVCPFSSKIKLRNEGQAIFVEALNDPSITTIVCTGPAGTGKTFLATIYALEACRKRGKYDGVSVIPCDPDSSGKLGALPGNLNAKMDPSVRQHKNAIEVYLLMTDNSYSDSHVHIVDESKSSKEAKSAKKAEPQSPTKRVQEQTEQLWESWFKNHPVYYSRGLSIPGRVILLDEFQDHDPDQANVLMTRKGERSLMIITGDVDQVHTKHLNRYNNGLVYAREMLKGSPEVAQVPFIPSEVVRDSLVKFIIDRKASYYDDNTI